MATAGTAFVTLGTVEAAQALTLVGTYNGNSYYRTNTASSWLDALGAANNNPYGNGTLVTINDAAEQSFLNNAFGTTQQFWIGLNDIGPEGNYRWASGQPVTYTNWGSGEPNNFIYPDGGDEDAVVMNFNGAGLWNDARSSDPFIGIVEVAGVPAQAVPFEFSPGLGILALGACGAIAQLSSKAKKLKFSNVADSHK